METTAAPAEFYERYGPTFGHVYAGVRRIVEEREEEKKRSSQRKDFHFLAANLANFLPEVPREDYERIYLNILTNHQLSAHSFQYTDFGALRYMAFSGHTEFLEEGSGRSPKIFCTYHLGGYRAVLAKLLHVGYPLALVIDNKTYRGQKEFVERVADQISQETGRTATVDVLDAETPDIGRQMAMAIARGRSVLIFLDGNTGVGGIYQRTGRQLKIPFLNGEIYSRTGIAMLSHALKTPIIPIISYYHEVRGVQVPHYWSDEPIDPRKLALPQDEYVRVITVKLYDLLAAFLRRYVDQWESWFYFHKFLDLADLKQQEANWMAGRATGCDTGGTVCVNQEVYGLFKLNDDAYLFHKRFYTAYPVNAETFDALEALGGEAVPQKHLRAAHGHEWVDNLLRRDVLMINQPETMS